MLKTLMPELTSAALAAKIARLQTKQMKPVMIGRVLDSQINRQSLAEFIDFEDPDVLIEDGVIWCPPLMRRRHSAAAARAFCAELVGAKKNLPIESQIQELTPRSRTAKCFEHGKRK